MIKLLNLTGSDLEKFGQTVFVEMGFTCIHPLTQPRLTEIEPEGEYPREEKLEIDYLIPSEKICLIGTITATQSIEALKQKHLLFRNHFGIVTRLEKKHLLWKSLGVPKQLFNKFGAVNSYKGFFITTVFEDFETNLSTDPNIQCLYRTGWKILVDCKRCLDRYSNHPVIGLYKKIHRGRLSPFRFR